MLTNYGNFRWKYDPKFRESATNMVLISTTWQKDADGMPQVGNVEGHEYDSTYNYPDRPICYDEFPQTIMPNGNYPNPTQV